ncbi:Unknown protein [Striga hermonthica]|uniref:Transposase n=1 Tax=Striga hermonthica TaxID=68872 RepID=A0A9N7NX50_STRHE|nr:Unknown protein [Striga hermonthica]
MDNGVDSWIHYAQSSNEYAQGVEDFLNHAFSTRATGDQIICPCKDCYGRFWHRRDEVYNHLIYYGTDPRIKEWHFPEKSSHSSQNEKQDFPHDDIEGLIYDTHRDIADKFSDSHEEHFQAGMETHANMEAKKFFKLVEDGKQAVYPGCKSFSKLSFIIRLYLFKCVHGLSNTAFSNLLEIIQELIPEAVLPKSFSEAKKMVKDLGLDYQKIDACRNDCMLFWKDHKSSTSCHVCHAPRWKEEENQNEMNDTNFQHFRRVPAKVVWHFPLKPRLQRLYMCAETAQYMRWHEEKRVKDGNLRHPADAKGWKDFDSFYPNFAKDCRNVRLGLSSDGFNPFRTMSTTHSTWPVVLINYNLPPWLFMKPEFLILSLLIPGPVSPGNDIDVYLQPLIDDLKDLWELGVGTYDALSHQTFDMHAALQATVSDFPGYAMLSGWSTKGRFACPSCHYETDHLYLKHSKKSCYMGNRRFLDANHCWRRDKKSFNGESEKREAPNKLTGTEVLHLLKDFKNKFGKTQPRRNIENCPWKKKSCFFDLPYWEHNTIRHHLDPMHIVKNVFDSILGTLLDIPGKTKDHLNARLDLKEMGIRSSLHPIVSTGKRLLLPRASFSMTKHEKTLFCEVIKNAKLPQGCGSNISRCVQMRELKVSGYKSHDAHIMMQHLLPVAVRKSLPKQVALALIRLSAFFRGICSKVINPLDLDLLQREIVETLCTFEKIFPPSFFDIIMHLPIHLVDEVRLSGPVSSWWMFGPERYLGELKTYVGNRSRPEGSIAEGYLAEECLTFCSRYLHDGSQKKSKNANQSSVGVGAFDDKPIMFFKMGHPVGRKRRGKKGVFSLDSDTQKLAHRYVIFNCEDKLVEKYIMEHEDMMTAKSVDKKRKRWRQAQQHSQEFMDWFKKKVELEQVSNHIKWLALGPSHVARRYTGYFINGYKFYTKARDAKLKTQNSGVTLTALTSSFASTKDSNPSVDGVTYYGRINDIIEIDYWGSFSVVLFRCDWFKEENDSYGLTRVNFNNLCYEDDPFVLASQVHQVFFVQDATEQGCYYAMKKLAKEFINIKDQSEDTYFAESSEPVGDRALSMLNDDYENSWSREGVPPIVLDEHQAVVESLETNSESDDSV